MLEDTNSLDGAQLMYKYSSLFVSWQQTRSQVIKKQKKNKKRASVQLDTFVKCWNILVKIRNAECGLSKNPV